MSDPSHDPLQSDAVSGGSPPPNEETLVQPDSGAAAPAESVPVPDPAEENSPGEEDEEDEEGEEVDDDTSTVSSMDLRPAADSALASPTGRRGDNKRRKGKGKGKRKPHAKKLLAIEEKLRNLRSNLNPIPFVVAALKIQAFTNHEKLFKKLGLWEFVHIDFDRTMRTDLIAQLIANYNPKLRSSSVNGYRVGVNRADLARSLKLPVKKEKGKAGGAEVDLDWEVLSDDSVGFIADFVSDWVLLHEDTWMTPSEVMEWMKLIKEGHPEKVDWAGLLWFMVEKELKQGGQLKDCYYASHLQQLIKCQQGEVFLMGEEPVNAEAESGAEVEVVKHEEVSEGIVKESEVVEIPAEERGVDLALEGPSTELTLGQDGEKEVEMVDAENEKCKGSDEEEVGEEREQWLLNGKNNLDEHFMQPCSTENAEGFGSFEHVKDEEVVEGEEDEDDEMDGEEDGEGDEEEEGHNNLHFTAFSNGDSLQGDEFTGNYLQGVEGNQMAFTSEEVEEQLPNHSSVDINVQNIASAPSFYNNSGKRVIEHDYHDAVIDSNKRMRVNESWDAAQFDFGTCMDQIQQMAHRAKMLHEEREQAAERSTLTQQLLMEELHKRDYAMEQFQKARMEETQKKDFEIWRLEREVHLLGSMVHDYRKSLKDVRKRFAEYRERAQLSEESTYKDVEHGLMLTAREIERRRKMEEEEYKMKCLVLEQQMKEEEKGYNAQMLRFLDTVDHMNQRLVSLEADAKELIALHSKKRIPQTEEEEEEDDDDEEMHEVAETQPVPEPDEPVSEVFEAVPSTELEEQVAEVAEDPAIPQGDEKVVEVAEPPSVE